MTRQPQGTTPTGIKGFDYLSYGGLPAGRSTLVTGTAGCGKTVLTLQFLRNGIEQFQENGVLVTFEERPEDLISNVRTLGWDLSKHEEAGRLAIVDACADNNEYTMVTGEFDLAALLARVEHAVRRVNARRAVVDGTGALLMLFGDAQLVRGELQRLTAALRQMKVTAMITVERTAETNVARFNVEEFVADNVVILRNRLENERRRRTLEILKFRGATHQKGEFPFTIDPVNGVNVAPISNLAVSEKASTERISVGVEELDQMCGGGMLSDSFLLVSGPTGTGKTLMVTEFMKAGIRLGRRSLLFAYEEDREELIRNAAAWGIDYRHAEKKGLLKILSEYPEMRGLEDHLIHMQRAIAEFNPERVAIDSISSLERVSTPRAFRELILGVLSYLKVRRVAGLFTYSSPMDTGGTVVTSIDASTISDAIILLRYVELNGGMRRAMTILKMRGTPHDTGMYEYTIDCSGMHIHKSLSSINGILNAANTQACAVQQDSTATNAKS